MHGWFAMRASCPTGPIPNVGQLLIDKLREIGATGLCYDWHACGCGLDDLSPGDCLNTECVPAREITVTEENRDLVFEGAEVGDKAFVPLDSELT